MTVKGWLGLGLVLGASHAQGMANEPTEHAVKVDGHYRPQRVEPAPHRGVDYLFDLAWDSKYVSEGRRELDRGGIFWAGTGVQWDDLLPFAGVGRGDTEHYIEWNFGLEYGFSLTDSVEASVGYERIEIYGDERDDDNELLAALGYSRWDKFEPALTYHYSTGADGHFVELSIHSHWSLTEQIVVSPYVLQAFDYGFVNEDYRGANHLQLGVEAEWALSEAEWALSGRI
ncbi:hypothetical protein [Ferrimonas pelagia]|uniref:Uncharacterized protein n=1 Tax=Ferrimonas pelagia TaxID=1177826 RepID=A0ABP9EWK1_9GAMM